MQRALADVQVWPDDMGNGYITDNGRVAAGQGVYYHTAMYTASRNQLHTLMRKPDAGAHRFAAANRPYLAELAAAAQALAPRVPDDRRDFYQAPVLTPVGIHLHSLAMLEDYCAAKAALEENDKVEALARAEQALRAADELFAALHRAETGKWATWYAGDLFVGMEGSRDLVRVLLPNYEASFQDAGPYSPAGPGTSCRAFMNRPDGRT